MSNRLRVRWPSPALIVACLALFAALGGSTYAATQSSASKIHFTNAKLKNGWTALGGHASPGYAKDSLGVVHLRGVLTNGSSGTVAFLLPKGMRPAHDIDVPALTSGIVLGLVELSPNGGVYPTGGNATNSTQLDGISFVAGE